MSEIKKMIERHCPNGVEFKKLGELGTFYGGLTGKSKKDFGNGNAKFITYLNVFSNPALDLSVTDTVQIAEGEKQNKVQYKDVLFTGSSEIPEESGMTSVVTQEIQEDYYLNSFCFGLRLNNPELFHADFLKHYFRCHEARKAIARTASGVTRFNVSKAKLANFEIPVPPLEVQSKIVEILDNYTKLEAKLEAELEAELEARRKQYEYYRNQLLSFDKWGGQNNVRLQLKNICEVINGRAYKQSELLNKGKYKVLRVGNFFSNDNWYYSDLELDDKYYCEKGDLLYAWSASFGPHIWENQKAIYHYHIWKMICSNKINKKFMFYWLQSDDMKTQAIKNMHGATMAHLTKAVMETISVPIPPLSEQERIVNILDRFEALTSDLQSGLPAEIEARRKQYEYYREKLLTFKRKSA